MNGKIEAGIFTPDKGVMFYDAVKELKAHLAKTGSSYAQMVFNEIYVTVSSDSNPDDIASIYDLKNKIRRMEAGYKD